jgi:hypothetical protein
MAASGKAYPMLAKSLGDKLIDVDSDTLKVALFSAYTYAATHQFLSDALGAGTQSSGTGYTSGGATLGSVTWTRSGDVYTLDAADTAWNAAGGSLAGAFAIIYDSTPASDATRPLIGYVNLDGSGGTLTATDANFTIAWNASGILTVTAS